MRKLLALLLCVPLLLGAAGCGSGSSYRSLKKVRGSGVLNVHANPSGQPYLWRQGDEYYGIEADFVRDLARELGVTPVWTEGSASEVVDAVRTGQADIGVGRIAVGSGAAALVDLTLDLGQENVCLLSLRPDCYDTLGALENGNLALVEGSYAASIFEGNHGVTATLLYYPTLDDAVGALAGGDILAVVCSEPEAAAVMALAGDLLTAAGLTNGAPARYAAVVAPGNEELLALANSLLEGEPHESDETPDGDAE